MDNAIIEAEVHNIYQITVQNLEGLVKVAAIKYTVPAESKGPATAPPTTWPCGPANEMVNPLAIPLVMRDGKVALGPTRVAEMERISKRPWKVTVAPGVVEGCRSVTLETVPDPLRIQSPIFRFRQNRVVHSIISTPPGSSRM
nr:hypothetical protein TorRG33x02_236110 [Ipomoea trifida]